MTVSKHVSRCTNWQQFNGLRLESYANQIYLCHTKKQAIEILKENKIPQQVLILGHGSNVIAVENWPYSILIPKFADLKHLKVAKEDKIYATAGTSWQAVVDLSVDLGYGGLALLTDIPGTVGAAPIQNIGAYGNELEQWLDYVEVYDRLEQKELKLNASQCKFAYRNSQFKMNPDRFLVCAIQLKLGNISHCKLEQSSYHSQLENQSTLIFDRPLKQLSNVQLQQLISKIRASKVPSRKIPNVGSCFLNPKIQHDELDTLLKKFPQLPHRALNSNYYQISAAYILEQLQWKGRVCGDAQVYPNHALIIINKGQATGKDVALLIEQMQTSFEKATNIRLETEPLLLKADAPQ